MLRKKCFNKRIRGRGPALYINFSSARFAGRNDFFYLHYARTQKKPLIGAFSFGSHGEV